MSNSQIATSWNKINMEFFIFPRNYRRARCLQKIQLVKKFSWKRSSTRSSRGIWHQRLKMHFPEYPLYVGRNCIGWSMHRFTENIVGRAREVVGIACKSRLWAWQKRVLAAARRTLCRRGGRGWQRVTVNTRLFVMRPWETVPAMSARHLQFCAKRVTEFSARVLQRSPARGIIKELPAEMPAREDFAQVFVAWIYISRPTSKIPYLDIGKRNWLRDNGKWGGRSNYRNNVIFAAITSGKYKLDTNVRRILRSSYQRPFARGSANFYTRLLFLSVTK